MKKNLFFISLSVFLFSCTQNKQAVLIPTQTQAYSNGNREVGEYGEIRIRLEQAAKPFAQLLEDVEFRQLLKSKAMEEFDGDYDVLYKDIKDHEFSDGTTLSEKLIALCPNFSDIVAEIPKFQVSVPVNCEMWDEQSFVPKVAIAPYALDESALESIVSYDSDLVKYELDATTDPEFTVVVVGVCERVNDSGILLPEFENEAEGGGLNGRVSGANEKLNKINCINLNAIESWANGAPELKWEIWSFIANSINSNTPTPSAYRIVDMFHEPRKRKDVNNTWYTLDWSMFFWYTDPNTNSSVYANSIKYVWIEKDYSGTFTTINISLSGSIAVKVAGQAVTLGPSVTVPLNIQAHDDQGGENTVNFQDPACHTYTTGIISWESCSN